ncbi:MAG: 2-oxoglutarate dehydrogenase E1 component [Pseudomonadota bacterium]
MTIPDIKIDSQEVFSANAAYIEMLYEKWVQNPSDVSADWQQFFAGQGRSDHPLTRPSWSKNTANFVDDSVPPPQAPKANGAKPVQAAPQAAVAGVDVEQATRDSIQALMLIRNYRVRGHLIASYDPLGLEWPKPQPELDPAAYGFEKKDYNRKIFLDGVLGFQYATMKEILATLQAIYCNGIGIEYMHIQYPEQKAWLQKKIEGNERDTCLSSDGKKHILRSLIEIESFEEFLQVKYASTKRFSIQGGDTAISGLETVLEVSAAFGVEEINIGMPHRGRMNVITKIMGKPYVELLSLFQGNVDFPEWVDSSGDVKYHLGVSNDRTLDNGNKIHLSLAANPSHLEVVNPVVLGKVRAKQDRKGDRETKDKVMSVLLHGDAAFAGQGSVAETLSLAELRGYRTGGTVHIIVNNQIGFTTSPRFSRFTPYPSDVAKMVQAPIFHVNGDDPEAVYFACKTAAEFRHIFKRDVVVDIFCYRKYGHNESDEPMFTQPLMYKAIAAHKLPARIYAEKLVANGVISQADVDSQFVEFRNMFDAAYNEAKTFKPKKADWLEGAWAGFEKPKGDHEAVDTGVELEKLKEIGNNLAKLPENFTINNKVIRQLEAKRKMMQNGEGLDWAMGEALGYGSLLAEGYPVRLSGQDSCRGTFSHRHSVLIDQANEERYTPLNNIGADSRFEVIDSSLSELAVLGFEYGYSLAEPQALTLWEAQFGDFANGAQMIIDQFISSGEVKWLRMSGLVMLLPHGYEGMGPEHSSARLERFLQMCGEDNMQIVNCTTPANFFHVLRRQIHRKFRKPLVVMTPKSLLRNKAAISPLADFAKGTSFKRVIPEVTKLADDKKIKRVIFTSGKVYYDLFEEREKRGVKDVAIVRVEQYYPFPEKEISLELARYKNAEVVWCQEEPENMGAWRFIGPKIGYILEDLGRKDLRIKYAGRPEAASPAVGYVKIHEKEQKQLVDDALNLSSAGSSLLKKVIG